MEKEGKVLLLTIVRLRNRDERRLVDPTSVFPIVDESNGTIRQRKFSNDTSNKNTPTACR
jgi:hypothetical protein